MSMNGRSKYYTLKTLGRCVRCAQMRGSNGTSCMCRRCANHHSRQSNRAQVEIRQKVKVLEQQPVTLQDQALQAKVEIEKKLVEDDDNFDEFFAALKVVSRFLARAK